ncbi:hypothetical protein [Streptomyces sp. NPDC059828]|uniref:hypothetical protein n=1 Tax=Streptomyces sp. NPDC059828 TaxID=3346965 RepID=UPI00364FD31F
MTPPPSARRWAELARDLEFHQLPELRRQAEGWRTALSGLTALLAVLVVLKGQDNLAQLSTPARYAATALVTTAFALLVTGTLLAVRASHGRPGSEIVLGGQALRRWTEDETVRVTRSIRRAAVSCVAGLVLAASAVGVTWTAAGAPPDHLVRVRTATAEICGELVSADREGMVVRSGQGGGDRKLRTVARRALVTLTPVTSC